MKAKMILVAMVATLLAPVTAAAFQPGDRVTVTTNTVCDGVRYAKPIAGEVRGVSPNGNVAVRPDGCSRTRVFLRFMVKPAETGGRAGGVVQLPRADLEAINRIVDRALAQ